ncbi:hypothetical protein VFPFJ_05854 [Purpureocillium lilacinum]|uniref:Uncharacterized protein n=1 Tax=Purpureocillium lilacinum TaxID=33203 RepID=A0A179HGK9_PURLI|nr:hypothetical protein VFPFJ_05854 [Purpureocillium lilacinum]OAQ89445.1 hypothetical protein VFPFJ_05854 [Purpureocillium lilacinum]
MTMFHAVCSGPVSCLTLIHSLSPEPDHAEQADQKLRSAEGGQHSQSYVLLHKILSAVLRTTLDHHASTQAARRIRGCTVNGASPRPLPWSHQDLIFQRQSPMASGRYLQSLRSTRTVTHCFAPYFSS